MACNQCGKPGAVQYDNQRVLCVDCDLKFQQARQMEHDRNIQALNHLYAQMESTTGIYGVLPRYEVSQPTVHTGPVTQHNIQIHDSVVGAVNAGNIQKMNVDLDRVQVGGAPQLAEALQKLTEAVLASSELPPEKKTAAVEHLSHIANQAALPKEKRQRAISTTVVEGFERLISASSRLLAIWQTVKPLVEQLF